MQLVIISGKGGTGKTTIVSSFAHLAGSEAIKVDCDVDASNLHLMFNGKDLRENDFYGSKKASIDIDICVNCGKCNDVCRFDAIDYRNDIHKINEIRCEGCGACQIICPHDAIQLADEHSGKRFLTQLEDNSHLSRAELFPGADGSGKLVSEIRKTAQSLNMFKDNLILIDGSPGIGCPVMASITGVDYGLIVTEPTQSGFEDFLRVYELSQHFGVKTYVMINKFDINCNMTENIINHCQKESIPIAGKIPYDAMVNQSNFESKPLVLYNESIAGHAIVKAWDFMKKEMEGNIQ
jgi:MinD superfamily P-loop ATPase